MPGKITYVGNPGTATTLAAPGYTIGDTSITVGSTTNFPSTGTFYFAIDVAEVVNGEQVRVDGTYCVFSGTVQNGTTINNLTLEYGTAQNYAAGSLTRVYITVSSVRDNKLAEALLEEHNVDGTHENVTADSLVVDGATSTADLTVTNAPTFTIGGALYKQSVLYTASDTYSKPTGLKFVVVEVQGGGGAGGGTGVTNASQYATGGGGGAGAYARKIVLAASLSSSETVTVGAAGAGASGAGGGSGGTSNFGSHCSANGGNGGSTGTTNTNGNVVNGGASQATASGDLTIPGQAGFWGLTLASNNNVGGGGQGGNSFFGRGGRGQAANSNGEAGVGYGAGGGGSCRAASQSATVGGAGGAGIVIVHEYF